MARRPKTKTFACGHPLVAENSTQKNGQPRCRQCQLAYMREYMCDRASAKRAAAWAYVPKDLRP